jgi:hypothetical protein
MEPVERWHLVAVERRDRFVNRFDVRDFGEPAQQTIVIETVF